MDRTVTLMQHAKSIVVVYHVPLYQLDMGCWRNVGLLLVRLRSKYCREFHFMKLCRPAYFVRPTRYYLTLAMGIYLSLFSSICLHLSPPLSLFHYYLFTWLSFTVLARPISSTMAWRLTFCWPGFRSLIRVMIPAGADISPEIDQIICSSGLEWCLWSFPRLKEIELTVFLAWDLWSGWWSRSGHLAWNRSNYL